MSDDTGQPQRPTIPPIPGLRPLTDAEVARLKRMAAQGQRAEEAAQQLPRDEPEQAAKPVINLDDTPENANWLRILAKRRQQQPQHDKENPTNG